MTPLAIICVDDDENILNSLSEQLKRAMGQDYEIETASNGWEALSVCAELEAEGIDIAVVVSDQTMPGMSGDEFLIRLHACYPKALKILLTGQAQADSVGNIINAASLYRYITKPWHENDLILTVKEALRRYGQDQLLTAQNLRLKTINQQLQKTSDLLLAAFEAADDGILILDNQGKIIHYNQRFEQLWGLNLPDNHKAEVDVLDLILKQLAQPYVCSLRAVASTTSPAAQTQYDLLKLNNSRILESYNQTQLLKGVAVGRVWGFRDVTEREQAKAQASYRASHDTLTQLPKRAILTCQLSEAIEARQKLQASTAGVAVIIADLDRFKMINDSLGHQIGDLLLKQVVQRLKNCISSEDMMVRWGGDEFTVLLPEVDNAEAVVAIANQIMAMLQPPFTVGGDRQIHITCSMGMAIYPQHGADAETLLQNADAALSFAKQQGRNNYQFYHSNITKGANQRLTVENLLRSALKKQEFRLYYQPIINLSTGKIAKMEALIRWQSPQLGLVSPYTFIPLAEENGEILPIGEWVLNTACAQNRAWQVMGLSPIKMSVNLSVRQFQQPDLVATITRILQQTRLHPNYLELEITETVTMQDTGRAKQILQQLSQLGIALSMDDFGTGYSSLGYLRQFPFHTLKIDRSFIKDLHQSSQDLAIVDAVVTLGKGLNLNVVAEGVETQELQEMLRNIGCEYVQGYLYSKPIPALQATELLRQHNYIKTV